MIHINEDLWSDFLKICRAAYKLHGTEVQWWARVHTVGKKVQVVDWELPKQEVRPAFVETTPDQLRKFQSEVFNLHSGMTDEEISDANIALKEWCLWCHSHANMGSSYSTEDVDTLTSLALASERPYFGLVMNIKGENSLYVAVPFQGAAECYKVGSITVIDAEDESMFSLIKDRTTKYVPPVVVPNTVNSNLYNSFFPGKALDKTPEKPQTEVDTPTSGNLIRVGETLWLKKKVNGRTVLEQVSSEEDDLYGGYYE